MSGALGIVCLWSVRLIPRVAALHHDLGLAAPLRLQLAGSPWWVAGCFALAGFGVAAGRARGQRRYAGAWVLTSTTLLLMAAALFTIWAAIRSADEVICCPT